MKGQRSNMILKQTSKKKSNVTVSLEASIFYCKLFSRIKLLVYRAWLKSFILERRQLSCNPTTPTNMSNVMVISIKQNIQETVILTMSELTKWNDQNNWKKINEENLQGIEYVVRNCPLTENFLLTWFLLRSWDRNFWHRCRLPRMRKPFNISSLSTQGAWELKNRKPVPWYKCRKHYWGTYFSFILIGHLNLILIFAWISTIVRIS